MREHGSSVTEHDPERPWIVHRSEHFMIELKDGVDFFSWAQEHWPAPRFRVELDPWQLTPESR
jgi:hypothetical protein